MFKRILMALKFAPASEFALVKGIELAKIHGAELHIFHALDYTFQGMGESDPKLIEIQEEIKDRYEARIKPILGDFEGVRFTCQPADPGMEVCKQAIQIDADLILLGCHQLPEDMFLGRIDYIGSTILEKAPCPVMVIPLCK